MAEVTVSSPETAPRRPVSVLRQLRRYPSALVGGVMLLAILAVTLLAPVLFGQDPMLQDIMARMRPPSWYEGGDPNHLLGTDQVGRDTLARVLYGGRTDLFVAGLTVLLSGSFGITMGLIAGYVGGRVDYWISTLIYAVWSFPTILLALVIVAVLGAGLPNLILALVVTSWAPFARLVRSQTVALREREFVEAANALGAPTRRILFRHLVPNLMSSILVIATNEFGHVLLSAAALSFLGLGVPPEIPSWGGMLNEARNYLLGMAWMAVIPGVAIFLTVLSVNLIGDGLRDLLDPRIRNK